MTSLKRVFKITPAWRDEKPHRYGQHGAHAFWLVKGPKGTIEMNLSLNWLFDCKPFEDIRSPYLWDVQAHKIADESDRHRSMDELNEDCAYLPEGETCVIVQSWKDPKWIQGLIQAGSDWLWPKLEEAYGEAFEDGPPVVLEWTPIIIDESGRFHSPHDSGEWT